ncbi:MAG: alpha/beta hydrolase [Parvibaculaceae bacterium]
MNAAETKPGASDLADEAAWPRATLDVDYNARGSVAVDVFEAAMRDYRALSEACRGTCLERTDIVYDRISGQTLDVLGDGRRTPRPVFVFIHGGYWRALSKHDSMFMAGALARHGVATVVIDYRLAPAASLREIVREVRAACAYLWSEGEGLGLDRNRMFVGGSSAGAHLAATILSGGWHRDHGVPEDVIKGALLVSGLYHLAPVAKCFAQEWARLDDGAVRDLSPAENPPVCRQPVIVAYAQTEAPGFTRQSRAYHGLLSRVGVPARLLEIGERNHFDVILDLADEASVLSRALMDMITRR